MNTLKHFKRLLSMSVSAAMLLTSAVIPAAVQAADEVTTTTVIPKMTYVDYDNRDTSNGYVTTAVSGYHKAFSGTISWRNTGWNVNKVAYLKIDASAVKDPIITAAQLSIDVSGSTDNKRTTNYGLFNTPYTAWDNTLTYSIASSNGMLSGTSVGGDAQGTSTKSSSKFETKTFDITDVLANDDDRIITIGIYETEAAGGNIKNPSVTITSGNTTAYTVTYSVNGETTYDNVLSGKSVAKENIPDTASLGQIFTGWQINGTDTIITTEQLKSMAITSDTTFTAQYKPDPNYIEAVTKVEITGEQSMTFGPDPDTAASNAYRVVITGERGTVLTEDNIDPRVTDFKVAWDIEGFATENDQPGQYCDSYGSFAVNNSAAAATSFELRNVPMNFYGNMTATVTYNGKTFTASKCVTALGDKSIPTNRILPDGGYPTDFNKYPDALLDYNVNVDNNDAILGNFYLTGSDTGKQAKLATDSTGKYLNLTKKLTSKSNVITHSINPGNRQAIFTQKVRFNSNGGAISFTSGFPTWSSNARYSRQAVLEFNNNSVSLNSVPLTDSTDATAAVKTGTWYDVVISIDCSTYKLWAKIFDSTGKLIGEASNVAMETNGTPGFYSIGLGNSYAGTMDLAGYEVYYPTADMSAFILNTTQDTLSIPKGDTAELTASLKTAAGYELTGAASWTVLEEDMKDSLIITPDKNDSHKALVSLADTAEAGEATVQVNIGGYTKTILLNITSSAESIKFTSSKASVAIPLDDSVTKVEYSAAVIDGNGNGLDKAVTLSVYDKNNTAEYTLPSGITFNPETGVLTVDKTALACTFTIRATGSNSDGNTISKAIKVTVHGLSFDFGAADNSALAEGYTAVSPDTSYTAAKGYGISSGTAAAAGTGSDNADTDYLEGSFTFKANVTKGKMYTVDITYSGTLTTAYVNSDLAGYTLGENSALTKASYTFAVPTDILDLTVSNGSIASVTITKNADREPRTMPVIHHVGDSTSANNGSWAYATNGKTINNLALFYNNGAGGRNLCTYYTQGKLAGVLNDMYPGDILMFGNNGTNGLGSYFEEDINYYLDAAEAMGAKIIINSYTPHGAVGNYSGGYNSKTNTFDSWRRDSGDSTTRKVAEERASYDPRYLGFVEIGKNADAIFNAYVKDYAKNGYSSADAAAQAIIACFSDHNHYKGLAAELMLYGYEGCDTKGIIDQIAALISPKVFEAPIVTDENGSKTAEIAGDENGGTALVPQDVTIVIDSENPVKNASLTAEIAGNDVTVEVKENGETASVITGKTITFDSEGKLSSPQDGTRITSKKTDTTNDIGMFTSRVFDLPESIITYIVTKVENGVTTTAQAPAELDTTISTGEVIFGLFVADVPNNVSMSVTAE